MHEHPDGRKDATAPPSGSERIARALSRAGLASRRDAERMVAEGRVAVNGRVIDTPATRVTAADRITVDGIPLAAAEPPRLWRFHKPAGIVTTARDEKGRPTVFDILPAGLPRVMTVGRLDLTSEGLLLLTNDGALKRRLELPATGWTRRYRVRVNGRPDDAQLAPLRAGLVLDGERFRPMAVTIDRQQGANAWLTVAIREGRNREVRRAMEALGLTVNRLIRIGYGPFRLGDLAPGAVEEVRGRVLRDQLGPAGTPAQAAKAKPPPAASPPTAPPAAAPPPVPPRREGAGGRPPRPASRSPRSR
jgi:23S rRNA pseudouridine2605 synthase